VIKISGGTHYFPQNKVSALVGKLSPEAILVASGYTSGDIGKAAAGSHPRYDNYVEKLFNQKFGRRTTAVTGEEMKDFIDNIAAGKNPVTGRKFSGQNEITKYLDKNVNPNMKKPLKELAKESIDDIMKRGATSKYNNKLDDAVKNSKKVCQLVDKLEDCKLTKKALKSLKKVVPKAGVFGAVATVVMNGGDPKAIASDLTGATPEQIDAFLENPTMPELKPSLFTDPVPFAWVPVSNMPGHQMRLVPGAPYFEQDKNGKKVHKGNISNIVPAVVPPGSPPTYHIELDTGLTLKFKSEMALYRD
jgi:hypothetical protein